jgi:hypothetical protein
MRRAGDAGRRPRSRIWRFLVRKAVSWTGDPEYVGSAKWQPLKLGNVVFEKALQRTRG